VRRVLLDQGFAPATAVLLRAEGWDAIHVADAGLDRAEDSEILEFARQKGRVCVTLDHDFHARLALTKSGGPSVIFVRLEGLKTSQQVDLIRRVWTACEDAILIGAAVSVDEVTIRVRKLPLR
jgi:predicted nuclease of predicted toxin-antitoxin system